jgi:transketolase
MEGNRGLVYARVMRTESAVLYGEDFAFEYGRGYVLREAVDDAAVIVSSGRGVHEALTAAARCQALGVSVGVIDMPSVDEALLLRLHDSAKTVFLVEQNNGYLWQNFLKVLHRNARGPVDLTRIVAINTLGGDGRPRFIHSGDYEDLPRSPQQSVRGSVAQRWGRPHDELSRRSDVA